MFVLTNCRQLLLYISHEQSDLYFLPAFEELHANTINYYGRKVWQIGKSVAFCQTSYRFVHIYSFVTLYHIYF